MRLTVRELVGKGPAQGEEEQQQKQQLQLHEGEEEQRVYLVTKGLRSQHDKGESSKCFPAV